MQLTVRLTARSQNVSSRSSSQKQRDLALASVGAHARSRFAVQRGLEPHDSSQTFKIIVRFKNDPQISKLGFQSEL
jgi:hypothetical protein